MPNYIFIVSDENGNHLGEFNDIRNALIFIQAYYEQYYVDAFSLVISKIERK